MDDADRAYTRAVAQARAKLDQLLREADQWAEGRRTAADMRRQEAYSQIDAQHRRAGDRAHQQFGAHMTKLAAERQAARDLARARASAAGPVSTLPPLPSSLPAGAFLPLPALSEGIAMG
jgi:vacuolar-type H+-ATPase subunit E/Vma4